MKFAIVTEDWINDRLKPVFIPSALDKRIEDEI
jgi:hypothetical protein